MNRLKSIALRWLPPIMVPKAWGSPFEAANWSPRRGSVPGASPTDARKELTPGVRTELVRKSRYLHKNSGFVRELVANMAIYSTGDGIRAQAQSPDPDWNRAAEEYFAFWSARCEVNNAHSYHGIKAVYPNAPASTPYHYVSDPDNVYDGTVAATWRATATLNAPWVVKLDGKHAAKFLEIDGVLHDGREVATQEISVTRTEMTGGAYTAGTPLGDASIEESKESREKPSTATPGGVISAWTYAFHGYTLEVVHGTGESGTDGTIEPLDDGWVVHMVTLPPDFLRVPWAPSVDVWFYSAYDAETLTYNGEPISVPDLYSTVFGGEDLNYESSDGMWTLVKTTGVWRLQYFSATWINDVGGFEQPFIADAGGAGGSCRFLDNFHPHEVITLPGGLQVRTSYDYGTNSDVIEASQDGGATWAAWTEATYAMVNNDPGWGYGQSVPVNNHTGPDGRHYAFLVNSNEAYLAIAEIPEA